VASKQISARLNGDDYQARFFWYMASQLLLADSNVAQVNLEFDEATHVDDVAVFYKHPGPLEMGKNLEAEFFQIKYHVDYRDAYAADELIDPTFIGSTENSFLERFFKAYNKLKGNYSWFTLNLVSNWIWKGDDTLAKSIRDSGELPDVFFTSTKGSVFGKIRKQWLDHLCTDEVTFTDFAKRLRFKLNYFGNRELNSRLSDRLMLAGLQPIDSSRMISPYDELARKLVQTGMLKFDKDTLFQICQREHLIKSDPFIRTIRTIGIRSFIHFAENMGIETDSFVCVADQFEGRFPRNYSSWLTAAKTIKSFIASQHPYLNSEDNKVLLDCHSSLAFLAGYLMTHRARVFPSGPRNGIEIYKPIRKTNVPPESLWKYQVESLMEGAPNLAVVISVANQVDRQVREYLERSANDVGTLMILEPICGTGAISIADGDQAWAMACALTQIVRRYQVNSQQTLLFISAPNFLTFFIGQQSRYMGRLTLFEYMMEDLDASKYEESITIPLPTIS
jgi:hypothetical protein